MEQAFAEYAAFLENYASILEELSDREQEKYRALISFDGEQLAKAIAGLQSGIMQLDSMEARRMALQEAAGFGGATFRQVLDQAPEGERPRLQLLFRRAEMAVGNIKFMNGKSLAVAREGLAALTPEALGENRNLYAPPARGKTPKAAETAAAFEAQY